MYNSSYTITRQRIVNYYYCFRLL